MILQPLEFTRIGHESINATQIYTHVTEEAMQQAYSSVHPRAHKK